MNIPTKIILPLTLVATLIGCGGGGGGSAATTTAPPTTPAVSSFFKAPNVFEVYAGGNTSDEIYKASIVQPTTGDFNGDGFLDMIVTFPGTEIIGATEHTKAPIKIYINDTVGGFTDGTAALFPGGIPTTEFARKIVVSDFNGDGRDDIFIGDHGLEVGDQSLGNWGAPDTLILSNGNIYEDKSNQITMTTLHGVNGDAIHYTHGVSARDFDEDGDIDLLYNTTTGAGTVIMVNTDGLGNFTELTTMAKDINQFANPQNTGGLWSVFIDADHKDGLDYVTVNDDAFTPTGYTNHAVYLNDGSNDFNVVARQPLPAIALDGPGEFVTATDVNGDGWEDLIVGNTLKADPGIGREFGTQHVFQILINNADGTGTFTDETSTRLTDQDWTSNFESAAFMVDLNNDGVLDMAFKVGDAQNSVFRTYLNVNGVFTRFEHGIAETLGNIVIADFNNDNKLDIMGTLAATPSIVFIEASESPVSQNGQITIGINGTNAAL